MIKKFLLDIIKNYYDGLVVLGLATGAGKTKSIYEVIKDHLKEKTGKRFYFITNQHINIKSVFKDEIKNRDDVLYLPSRKELIKNVLIENKENRLYEVIKGTVFFEYIKDQKALKDVSIKFLDLDLDNQNAFINKAISEITKAIRSYCESCIKDKNYEHIWLKDSEECKVIRKIFPEITLDNKKVIFMTTKRMMAYFNYIYKPAKMGWEHIAIDKEAVVFFDESDAVANVIQQSLFENLQEIDLINSLRRLDYYVTKIPTKFQTELNNAGVSKYAENIIKVSKEISEDFGIKNTFYIENEEKDKKLEDIKLFRYLHSSFITAKDLYVKKNGGNFENYIYNNTDSYDYKISDFVNRVVNFIDKSFITTAYNYAYNYATSDKVNKYQAETNLKSFLDYFLGFENNSLKSYTLKLFNKENFIIKENYKLEFNSFYESGLDITNCFTASDGRALNIFTYRCFFTKEKILQDIARNNLVFCVSATAEINYPTDNFDLKYLKKSMCDKYIEIPQNIKKLLSQHYYNRTYSSYKNCKIETLCINPSDEYDILKNLDLKEHEVNRYKNCFGFIKKFAKSDATVALAFFNKSISDDISFQTLKIEDCLEQYGLSKENLIKIDASVFRESENHNDKINERLKLIYEKGLEKKLLIITTYGSAANGINIQYDKGILETGQCSNEEIDIDMLYLDEVTNLLPKDNNEISDLMAAMYSYTYLYENNELATQEYKSILHKLFNGSPIRTRDYYYKCTIVNNKAIALLNQAVGRICRTNNKREVIRICYSKEVEKIIKRYTLGDFVVTREIKALYENIKNKSDDGDVDVNQKVMNNHVSRVNFKSRKVINNLLKRLNKTDNKAVEQWQNLRYLVLTTPSTNIADDILFRELYIDTKQILPEYKDNLTGEFQYKQNDDYETVEIVKEGGISISSSNCGLDKLMKHKELKEYFNKKGYATSIDTQARYIMSPIIYNNIYKGILGEEVVDFIFTQYLNCKLEQPYEKYEQMDFKVAGKNIYIDAKLHKFSNNVDYKDMRPDLLLKAKKLNAEKLFILNVFKTKKKIPQQQIQAAELDNGTKVFVISWLIDENNKFSTTAIKLLSREICE